MSEDNFFGDSESLFSAVGSSMMMRKKTIKADHYLSMYNEREEAGFVMREMKPVKVKLN
jgi:hypothetical protein